MDEEYLDKKKRYLLGVSGGCDSMSLLDMMRIRGYEIGVAHVNYNLRDDTDIDYQVTYQYCQRYNIPFYYKDVNPDEYQKGNFQKQARDIRYRFYSDMLTNYNYDAICLAHHEDDVIENIYMYKERHTKTHYLGIAPVTRIKGMLIIRPLLEYRKKDLRAYCRDHQIMYHDDYTNFQTHFKRDQVRNLVLNHYSEAQKQELLAEARQINDKTRKKEQGCQSFLDQYHCQGLIDYKRIPKDLMDTFLYMMLEEQLPREMISRKLINEIKREIGSSKPNIKITLPIHKWFIKEYDNIYISSAIKDEGYAYTLDKIKEFTTDYFSVKRTGPLNNGILVTDADFPITIRTSQPGDRILTAAGHKKISRLFINNKIPANERKIYPLLVRHDGEILLVPGIAKRLEYLCTNPNIFVIKWTHHWR